MAHSLGKLNKYYVQLIQMLQNGIMIISCLILLVATFTTSTFGSQSQEDKKPEVNWKNFKSRDNLFTVQYPSNWTPSTVRESERSGPIDIIFTSPGSNEDKWTEVEFIQYDALSAFNSANESLGSEISGLQNDASLTKFQIERPLECSKYTLNGLQACSYIYEVGSKAEGNFAAAAVDALSGDGTEYEVYYKSTFDSFKQFLPTFEKMLKSFKTTGNNSAIADFSLDDKGITSLNATNTTSSNDDDFSLD